MVLLFLSLSSLSHSQEKTQNKLAERWVEIMTEELPKAFCAEKMYFRQCFQISENDCKLQTKQSFEKCLIPLRADLFKNFGAKGTKDLPTEGSYWGGKLGECAGIDYEKSLISKRINSAKCNDAKNWVP